MVAEDSSQLHLCPRVGSTLLFFRLAIQKDSSWLEAGGGWAQPKEIHVSHFFLPLHFINNYSLLRRLVTLFSQQATLLASNEAFKKQAESASDAAKKYMEENDLLKKVSWIHLTPFLLPCHVTFFVGLGNVCHCCCLKSEAVGQVDERTFLGVEGGCPGGVWGSCWPRGRPGCSVGSAAARPDSSLIKPTP